MLRCSACNGVGIIVQRLHGTGVEGQPLDDGEEHPTVCKTCHGGGRADGVCRRIFLGRAPYFAKPKLGAWADVVVPEVC